VNQPNNPEENPEMIRKTLLGLTAIAALGAAALAPTSASAWGYNHGWGHWGHWGHHYHWNHHYHWGYGFGPSYVHYNPDCYLVKKLYRSGAVRYARVCS
jgi:hypothetical protein